jgi:PKD repeat protein
VAGSKPASQLFLNLNHQTCETPVEVFDNVLLIAVDPAGQTDEGDLAWQGAGVIAADSPNAGAKDLIPVALTAGQVAFNIGNGVYDDTLNSSATVNDGTWHHVVVTRSLSTGNRQIFIDGSLDSSEVSSTALLNSPVLLTIGAKADASNPDLASPDYAGSNGYLGLLDDIQIYDRVLSDDEVAYLFNNPGTTVTSGGTPGLNVTASPLSGQAPLAVQFTSPGVDSAGNAVTNWSWSFGDGGTSTAQSPSYTYTTAGSFSPSLTAYSTYGATQLSVTGPGTITVTDPLTWPPSSPSIHSTRPTTRDTARRCWRLPRELPRRPGNGSKPGRD